MAGRQLTNGATYTRNDVIALLQHPLSHAEEEHGETPRHRTGYTGNVSVSAFRDPNAMVDAIVDALNSADGQAKIGELFTAPEHRTTRAIEFPV